MKVRIRKRKATDKATDKFRLRLRNKPIRKPKRIRKNHLVKIYE